MSNNAIQTISFFTTNECNLACSYCYEKNKNNQNADFVIAKEIIDNSFIKYSNKKVVFDFFGGEPFLNFIFIKKVVDYIEKKYIDKQFAFSVSTNGTILTEKVKKFLIAHRRKIEVGLSLDGCIKYHNDSRCNSFKDIDLS
jgi:sulfatase maturation enzyme AslB (radical SAM superfamily)